MRRTQDHEFVLDSVCCYQNWKLFKISRFLLWTVSLEETSGMMMSKKMNKITENDQQKMNQ